MEVFDIGVFGHQAAQSGKTRLRRSTTLHRNQGNPDIAHVLYLRGMMEKAGRGSEQIIKSCKDAQLPCPEWTSDPRLGVTLTLFAPEATPEATPEVLRLLLSLHDNMSRREIQDKLALKDPDHFREAYINPALKDGLIEMTIPDNPRNPRQKYRLTSLGKMTTQMPENIKKVKLHEQSKR